MAKKTTTKKTGAAPRFYEVVFHGKPKIVKAFLKGLLMGAERKATVLFHYDEEVRSAGKVDKIKGLFGVRAADCRVIVDAETSAYLKGMTRRIAEETGLEIAGNRSIRSASLVFEYHAYAPRYSDQILKALKALPKGVKLEGHQHQEKQDKAARGVEAYSVAHDFEADGEGRITGRVDLVIEVRRSFADLPLIECDQIDLNLA